MCRKTVTIKAAPEAIQKLVIDKVNYELEKILTGITLYDLEKEYQTYVDYGQVCIISKD